MVFSKAIALAAIFATLTSAAPMQHKRAIVYETVTEVDVTTVDTTVTIFPDQATPTTAAVAATTVPADNQAATPSSPSAPISAPAPPSTAASSPSEPAPTAPSPPPAPTTAPPPPPPAPTTTAPPAPPPAPTTTAPPPSPPAPTTTAPPPPPPAPSTTSTSATSTSAAPSPSSTGGSGPSGSGPSGNGDGTYYDTATTMTSPSYCDTANDGETENVVALSYEVMNESLCGASITVEYKGKTAKGTVVDKCMGCDAQSIDMSRAMFGDLSSLGAGRIDVSWSVN